jgi:uncharacterized protein YcfL
VRRIFAVAVAVSLILTVGCSSTENRLRVDLTRFLHRDRRGPAGLTVRSC